MLEQVVSKYYDEIYRFIIYHVGNRQIAEDLCQDTFVSYLENAGSFLSVLKARNYLYVIAKNKCIDYYRKVKLDYRECVPEMADERGEDDLREIEMRELLSHLDEEQREVIILRFFQNLKYREIAEIMEISVSKTKFLTAKALEQLQKEVL